MTEIILSKSQFGQNENPEFRDDVVITSYHLRKNLIMKYF
jgi:hypothetical protein